MNLWILMIWLHEFVLINLYTFSLLNLFRHVKFMYAILKRLRSKDSLKFTLVNVHSSELYKNILAAQQLKTRVLIET